MTRTTATQDLQALFAPQGIQDPYAHYQRARGHGEVVFVPEWGNAFVFGHAETAGWLRDARVSADRVAAPPELAASAAYGLLRPMMLFHDGAAHLRLRGLATQAFTPRAVHETQELVQGVVDDLLSGADREIDAVQDLAVPLPVTVITELLGLQGGDRERFRAWSESIASLLDGGVLNPERFPSIESDAREMCAYFRGLADDLRANPRPGLLSALAQAEAQGERLSNDELLANAVLLLVAGHETTTNLISGGILAFSQHPEQWTHLVQHPELLPNAVEELLRFVSPVQGTGRKLLVDALLGGVHVPAGTRVIFLLGAANRDARRFHGADRLDVTRPDAARHLSFASGPHYCLGAGLARQEAASVLRAVTRRFSGMQVPQQPLRYRPNFVLRGLERLRVELRAG